MSNSILHLENSFPWNKDPFYIFNNDDEKLAFKKWFIENANKYEINSFYKYASDLLGQVILSESCSDLNSNPDSESSALSAFPSSRYIAASISFAIS